MSVFRRLLTVAAPSLLGVLLWRCAGDSTCIRHSDCDRGYECSAGTCQLPPVPSDGGEPDAALAGDAEAGPPADGGEAGEPGAGGGGSGNGGTSGRGGTAGAAGSGGTGPSQAGAGGDSGASGAGGEGGAGGP